MQINKLENNYQLKLNDFSYNEDGNVTSNNSTWFLLRKSYLEERMNNYNLKEGDILRVGRITIKIKKIKFNKNKDKDNKDNKYNKDNKDNNNKDTKDNKDDISVNTNLNVKETQAEATFKKIYEKDENQKYKTCRICYLEDETVDNPLIQPCICSGSMKYIHLDCLKHWLQTSIFVKIEDNVDCSIYLYKTPECELCKTKYTDLIRHKGKLYEILDLKNDFNNYLIIESITLDKNQNKYLYVVNLDQPNNKISIGRGHDCQILLSDISVSRWHCFLTIDKKSKNIYIHDNNSKFGTLILVQTKDLIMSFQLKLSIQIGRTYLECLLKEPFRFFNCCGVNEKKNADFYYTQNKEISFFSNNLTIKNEKFIEHCNKFNIKNEENNYNINDNNLMTLPNLIDTQDRKNCIIELNQNNKKEESIVDDIEKLIYENEQSNNDNKGKDIIDEDIINNKNENQVERNNESINLLELNNNF